VGRGGRINEDLAGLFFGNPRPPKFSSVFLTLRTFVAVVASPYRSLAFEWGFERYGQLTTGIIPCHGTEGDNAHAGTREQLG
jgi:hypothetical protein